MQVAAVVALFKVGESHEVFFTKSEKKKRPWPRKRRRHGGAETEAAKVCGILRFSGLPFLASKTKPTRRTGRYCTVAVSFIKFTHTSISKRGFGFTCTAKDF